ncbi:MAG TPA: four helix bundle protein [Candidatus Paceibacterota bacterium]|nr:four helix bundle protein [Verrucomicrobiota bacterium]HRY51333.1 four helix bundle protein [Candidatus Paceibacterota bacterium]HSA03261.1 four helix bundle protein [Candidatus Paceibacterota bacterium]
MNYADWITTVPKELTEDSLWKMEAYRLGLFAADLAWRDVTKLTQDRRTIGLASQLYDAVGSIGANLSEGYSRGSGRDRARFYEYALGSARESRTWYFDGRHVLDETVTDHRLRFLTQIIRLLLTMVPQQRGQTLHDDTIPYRIEDAVDFNDFTQSPESSTLLNNVPLP